ncbi:MAG: hypothetical protein U0Q12_27405 [Vicinamibacterales bacterium]
MELRHLKDIDDFKRVVEMEREVWGVGYEDVVPVPMFAITVKRGGILMGAFDEAGMMVAFVYSLPGLKHGKPMQWSHMLGVLESYRRSGLGRELKLAQRARALEQGLDLIEWTYDPLQALNAHLNFRKLGVVVEEYGVNVYGESTSPLHGATPTDRFIASWYIARPHVVRRLEAGGRSGAASRFEVRSSDLAVLDPANRTTRRGRWLSCEGFDVPVGAERFAVDIPVGYTEMLHDAPALAHDWRLEMRALFQDAFAKGYRVVDFLLDEPSGKGRYICAPKPAQDE